MSKARFILVALICASPAILLWDGLIVQGIVAAIAAVALSIISRTLRPGETKFFISIVRWPVTLAVVPAFWIVIQVLPLRMFAHPIWKSAEAALGHAVTGAISVDPGATVVALGKYLSIVAVGLLSVAVAVDRQRAEWILFALTAASTVIALILLAHHLFLPAIVIARLAQAEAIDCSGLGAIIAGAACIRTIERYETRQRSPQRSVSTLLRTLAACIVALAICVTALIFHTPLGVLVAVGCGLSALAGVIIMRRFGLGTWGAAAIAMPVIGVAILLITTQPPEPGRSVLLTFAASSPSSSKDLTERILQDAPLIGTGAGTFAAIAPIYRGIDDPSSDTVASTMAAAFAIELGLPMLWLIAAGAACSIVILLKASLRRGRDSFYPAMGGSCLLTLLLLAFTNAGLLGTATSLIAAATLGLALAQSKSRTAQL